MTRDVSVSECVFVCRVVSSAAVGMYYVVHSRELRLLYRPHHMSIFANTLDRTAAACTALCSP